jgi:hypothetical protein
MPTGVYKRIRGEKANAFKGDYAGYAAKHSWVARSYGKPLECEQCGRKGLPEGMKRYYDWANISKKFKRERSDWKRLCKKCHAENEPERIMRGEDQGASILKEKDIKKIRKMYKKGITSIRTIAPLFNVDESTIARVIQRKTWKHIS